MNYSCVFRLFIVLLISFSYSNTQAQCSGNPPISTILTATNPSCNGVNDGCIHATITGGSGGQMGLIWSNGNNANIDSICGLASGTYSLLILDTINVAGNSVICYNSTTITLVNSFTINIIEDSTINQTCGGSNGAAYIRATGGTGTYSYLWSNGDTTQNIDSVVSNGYTITVSDANGCTASNLSMIGATGSVAIHLDSIHNNILCHGDTTGAIYVSDSLATTCFSNTLVINELFVNPTRPNDGASPNTAEFIELLGPPGMDISCYVITDGDWTITFPAGSIIPADGLFSIGNDTIWGAGTFDLDAENCNCYTDGGTGGGLLILTNGGEYLSLFDASGTFLQGVMYGSPSSNNLPSRGVSTTAGVINTIGLAGCVSSVIIPDSFSFEKAPSASANGSSISRNPDGTLTWTNALDSSVNACNATYNNTVSYLWSNGDTTKSITNLGAGIYTLTVTDTSSCPTIASYAITEPSRLVHTIVSIDSVSCHGDSNGQIISATSGATPTYSYNWSNATSLPSPTGLVAGTYTVTVTDANGCSVTSSATVATPSAIVLTDAINDVSCDSTNDGSITITPSGGIAGYTYLWDAAAGNQTTATINNLITSTYSLTVTDASGCVTTGAGYYVAPGIPVDSSDVPLQVLQGSLACDLAPTGQLTINTTGTYNYAWSNGSTNKIANNLAAGNYTVTITNGLGCFVVQTGNITAPFLPTINPYINTLGMTTSTVNTGSTININGGNDQSNINVTYAWSASSDVIIANSNTHTTTATANTMGVYPLLLTATSIDGCTDTASVVLTVENNYIGMPNAFTPNGDGTNDVFKPVGITSNEIIDFKIYNRFGQVVYNYKTNNEGWDGSFNGVAQAREVYLYILSYDLKNGTGKKTRRGQVTLLR